ncbi:MAG TPA: hypothetical protein DEH05_11430, partial [Propionibacteriaceae bacterium]|nr:hypothetical protein [Propionibacteriaceae bacterium]
GAAISGAHSRRLREVAQFFAERGRGDVEIGGQSPGRGRLIGDSLSQKVLEGLYPGALHRRQWHDRRSRQTFRVEQTSQVGQAVIQLV